MPHSYTNTIFIIIVIIILLFIGFVETVNLLVMWQQQRKSWIEQFINQLLVLS